MTKRPAMTAYHPLVSGLHFALMVLITMLTLHPLLLLSSLLFASVNGCLYYGRGFIKRGIYLGLSVGAYAVCIYPLFNHNGTTPLFYLNHMAVTSEAVTYGITMTILLITVFFWCEVGRAILDSERLLYLVGRIFPSLALMLSMSFRFLPLLRQRFLSIQAAQRGMGRRSESLSFFMRCSLLVKEISTLLSQTLEISAASSISMENRGYGVTKRTTYSRFTFRKSDGILCLIFLVLSLPILFLIITGGFQVNFFPDRTLPSLTPVKITAWLLSCLLALFPALTEGIHRKRN
ncbi:energy-coupling factor transport system permease protein [Lachnospiraceae bacterium KHCPX20]|nr:energy-coupling factor transport system permease protein [Lachnospiraceae bacterium KHCPX20]